MGLSAARTTLATAGVGTRWRTSTAAATASACDYESGDFQSGRLSLDLVTAAATSAISLATAAAASRPRSRQASTATTVTSVAFLDRSSLRLDRRVQGTLHCDHFLTSSRDRDRLGRFLGRDGHDGHCLWPFPPPRTQQPRPRLLWPLPWPWHWQPWAQPRPGPRKPWHCLCRGHDGLDRNRELHGHGRSRGDGPLGRDHDLGHHPNPDLGHLSGDLPQSHVHGLGSLSCDCDPLGNSFGCGRGSPDHSRGRDRHGSLNRFLGSSIRNLSHLSQGSLPCNFCYRPLSRQTTTAFAVLRFTTRQKTTGIRPSRRGRTHRWPCSSSCHFSTFLVTFCRFVPRVSHTSTLT